MDMHRNVRQSKDIAQDDGILHTTKFGELRTNDDRDGRGTTTMQRVNEAMDAVTIDAK